MCVKVIGYSERGMVNAICDDLSRRPNAAVSEFLSWISFPFQQEAPDFSHIREAMLLVEQSFSDYGDLDLLVLLDHDDGRRQAVFIEAKVSNDTASWLSVEDRWDEFLRLLDGGEGSTSNLFVQLHRKVRLVERLRANGDIAPDRFTPRGSLGENRVVTRAADELQQYVRAGSVWYVALLPDDYGSLATFFENGMVAPNVQNTLASWDSTCWGFLSWRTLWENGEHNVPSWPRTRAAFQWNEGQIFRNEPPEGRLVVSGQTYLVGERPILVVDGGRGRTCRIVRLDERDEGFFWRTESMNADVLVTPLTTGGDFAAPILPRPGATYGWNPRNERERLPRQEGDPHIEDDARVVIDGRPSWRTTRVRLVDGTASTPTFLVYTHHLRRQPQQ